VTWAEIDKHLDYIKPLLGTVTVSTIHQRLRDERKLPVSLTAFRRWVHDTMPSEVTGAQVTVLRDEVPPGSEAQIDYGFLGQWVNPRSGKRHRIWVFAMVLPCSRHMFVRPVIHLDQHAWTEAHVAAFDSFGGVPRRLVPDNLKTGVDKPDLFDPKINKAYAELATHYGALVDQAGAAKPKDKPRVERPMPYVRDFFWREREFVSIEHMQAGAVTWSRQVAGQRQCRPLGGAASASVFEDIEADELLPLPPTPFVLACWSTAVVGPDILLLTELQAETAQFRGRMPSPCSTFPGRARRRERASGSGGVGGSRRRIAAGYRKPMGAVSSDRSGRRWRPGGDRLLS